MSRYIFRHERMRRKTQRNNDRQKKNARKRRLRARRRDVRQNLKKRRAQTRRANLQRHTTQAAAPTKWFKELARRWRRSGRKMKLSHGTEEILRRRRLIY